MAITTAPPLKAGRDWGRAAALHRPIALFLLWDLVVRAGLIKAILLPTPWGHRFRRWSPAWPAARCCWTSA